MWIYLLGIVGELVLLGILSSRLTQLSFTVLLHLTRSRSVAITILTIILFPGTVIHELSHLFTAEILGVRTGKLTLVPESIEGNEVQSGSVAIAKTDPFRRTAIGIAPTITGVTTISALSYVLFLLPHSLLSALTHEVLIFVIFYLILAISNTMFSSHEDMNGVIPVAVTLALVTAASYLSGLTVAIPTNIQVFLATVALSLVKNLGIALAVNLLVTLVHVLFIALLKKQAR
jgi:hypothetical protein